MVKRVGGSAYWQSIESTPSRPPGHYSRVEKHSYFRIRRYANTPTRRHAPAAAGPFSTQPSGRGRLVVFRVARSTRMDPFDALSLAHGKPSDANAADTRDTGHVRNRIECPEQATARRMGQIWALYRQSGSDRPEKQPTDLRRHHHYMRDGTLGCFPYVNWC